jgi:hypothetical protein
MYEWGYIKSNALSKLDLDDDEVILDKLVNQFPYWANEVITQVSSSIKPKATFATFVIDDDNVGELQIMPDDFVSFGSDVSLRKYTNDYDEIVLEECYDDDIVYRGYKQLMFLKPGEYSVSYNARWFDFTDVVDDGTKIDVPNDILDCIPSYLASQGFKIDDEYKSSVFRNEYEMMLARIDGTHFERNRTFKIEGDW